jgi:hypothetical protein
MKKLIVFAVFSFLLGCPVLSGALDDGLDSGRSNPINFLQVPIPGTGGSNGTREIKTEGEMAEREKKEKEIRDKKVDDAIKKAWEGK